MLAAQAMAIEDKNAAEALALALKAHKLDPGLVPAALVAARVYASQNTPRKATKIIRETWAHAPHPDLAEVLAHARPGDGPEPRFERVRDLVSGSAESLEGAYALARAAVAAQRWDAARKTLEPFLADQPQARFCALMADIEEATGDKGRAREWLARAIRAPRDPMWVSDGVAGPRWVPISPVSGEIVPCQWKTPFEMVAEQKTETLAAPSTPTSTPAPAPVVESTPIRIAKPAMAELPRPPDDPGLDDDVGPRQQVSRDRWLKPEAKPSIQPPFASVAALAQLVEHIIRNDGVRCSKSPKRHQSFKNPNTPLVIRKNEVRPYPTFC